MIPFKRANMNSKKIFLWPVIISIIGHVALITVSSMVDLRDNVKAAELFTVQLTQPPPDPEPDQEEETTRKKMPQEKKPQQTQEAKPAVEGEREDTVDIGSSDVKYAAYLSGVKKKIMRIWNYPAGAYEKSEEGEVVIKISIDANGTLAQAALLTSSGFVNLDSGTLSVVQAAAPFQPLPSQYELSRLHIIASFRYRLKD
jgi:TonB family protein